MATELTTAEVASLIAPQLLGHVCAIADELTIRVDQWRPKKGADGEYETIDPKELQARQTSLKSFATNIDLLLKVARGLEADEVARGAPEDEAALKAEAARNLALPEP